MRKECCFRLSRRLWGGKKYEKKTPAWEANSDLAKVGSNHLRSPSIRPPFLTLQVPKVNKGKGCES